MGMYDTTAKTECQKRIVEAIKKVERLGSWLNTMKEEMYQHQTSTFGTNAFPIEYANTMMSAALDVYNEIARCNGSAVVRGIMDG